MELKNWILLIILLGGALFFLKPHWFDQSYGAAYDWGKDKIADLDEDSPQELNQDIADDGSYINPKSGKNYGLPSTQYSCVKDSDCVDFSFTAVCDVSSGDCVEI